MLLLLLRRNRLGGGREVALLKLLLYRMGLIEPLGVNPVLLGAVVLEAVAPVGGVVAHRTEVRLLPGMRPHVALEAGAAVEDLAADGAAVGPATAGPAPTVAGRLGLVVVGCRVCCYNLQCKKNETCRLICCVFYV